MTVRHVSAGRGLADEVFTAAGHDFRIVRKNSVGVGYNFIIADRIAEL